MSTEAMKLALEALIAEYYMENSSFAKRVNDIFKEALAEPQPEPRGPEYIGIPVAYQYCYPDGTWRCSFGNEINGSKPIASRALYARKDGK